jgi:hypothetical protein
MKMFRAPLIAIVLAAGMAVPQAALAVRPWLLPSETMFAGSGNEWLTIDAAISDDLFYPNHPGQPWEPVVTAPDGTQTAVENRTVGKLRTTFDVPVTQKGTYKIAVLNDSVMGSYMLNGERKPFPRGTTPATLASATPAGATDIWQAENNSRIETFVTAGEPTETVFKAAGKGLEMVPVTHPNDLAVGEAATFAFLLDGKPAAGLAVIAIPGGVRYRQSLKQIDLKTDAQGKVTITWPDAGMYWVSVSTGGGRGGEGGPGGPGGAPRPAGGGGPGGAGPGAGAPGAGAPGAGGPGAGGPGGEGGFRPPMTPPQRRASYAMVVEVQG